MNRFPFSTFVLMSGLLLLTAPQGRGQSGNVLLNPGFESGTTSWALYSNGSAALASVSPGFVGSKTGRVSITTPGTNVQLYQINVPLDPNTDYTLTFAAYSNTGHDLSVSLLQNVAPNTNYGLSNSVASLTTTWQTFTMNFRTTGFSSPVTDARFRFWLAPYDAAGDVYFIDNVVLAKAGTPPSITTGPSGQAVQEGSTPTFTISATGTAPLTYQWQKNGVDIPGAVDSSYTTPATTLGSDSAVYR